MDPAFLSPALMHPQLLHPCCMWAGNMPQPDVPSCSPAVHISASLTADQALPSPKLEQRNRNLQVKQGECFNVPAEQQKASVCSIFVSPKFIKIPLKKEKTGCVLVKALIISKYLCQLNSNWIQHSLKPISAGQKSLLSFKYKH